MGRILRGLAGDLLLCPLLWGLGVALLIPRAVVAIHRLQRAFPPPTAAEMRALTFSRLWRPSRANHAANWAPR